MKMIFKIETKKVMFVEATNKEEAEKMAFDANEIISDETIIKITKSSKKEMINFALNPFGERDNNND